MTETIELEADFVPRWDMKKNKRQGIDPEAFRKSMGIPEPKQDSEERPWFLPTTARVQGFIIGIVSTTTCYAMMSPELAWKLKLLLLS